MKRKQIPYFLLVAALTLCATNAEAKSICLDAGHGGSDPGATGCSMIESQNNLDAAKRLEKSLKAAGWTVYQTRTTETDVGLTARSDYANSKGVDTFASIHNNAFNGSATGIETLCQLNNLSAKSGTQAKKIQNRMVSIWSLANRGAKEQDLSVTRRTNMPATLSELAFIDNCSKDAPYLKARDTHVQHAMEEHCKAITELWDGSANSKCVTGGGSTEPENPPAQTTGKLMAGTFKDTIDADHWLGGVKYTINGKSQTSASSYAMMTFELPLGVHKATAEKSGYNTTTKECEAVTATATAWCSIALTAAQTAPAKGKATGSVIDGSNSSKVAASVKASNGSTASYDGKTDWSFDLDAGTYTITANADGYEQGSVSCVVTSGKTTSCPITLNPKKGTITGQVLDSSTTSAIVATVKLGSQSVNYQGTGEFTFTVDAGSYTVEADAEGYQHNQVSCQAERGKTTTCNITLTPSASSENGTLKGTMTDSETGDMIAGDVKLSDNQVYHYTGRDEYQFSVPAGEYTVTGTADGYAQNSTKCTVKKGEVVDCPIKLTPTGATVSGYVFLASDKSKHVAATVTLDDPNNSKSVEYDGVNNWTMAIEPGKYAFDAVTADGAKGSATCKVVAGQNNICNIAVVSSNTKTGTLSGIVYDSRNEKLYLSAQVEVEGYGSVEYDGENKFKFTDLPVGEYNVTAKAYGYYNNTVSCEVNDVEPGYCKIPLTIKPENGADTTPAQPAQITVEDSCSAQPLTQNHSHPAGLAALLLGMLTAFGIRRRKGDER